MGGECESDKQQGKKRFHGAIVPALAPFRRSITRFLSRSVQSA
jgi:hypothetical protein